MRAVDVLGQSPVPATTVVLPPSAWVATYKQRPTEDVAVGLRFLSHDEATSATTAAEAKADESRLTGDAHTLAYNDELMVQAIGYATCDPNDATRRFFTLTAEDARRMLTPDGVRRLFDALQDAEAVASPLIAPADDRDLADLGEALLDPDALAHLSAADDATFRRMVRVLLNLLSPA